MVVTIRFSKEKYDINITAQLLVDVTYFHSKVTWVVIRVGYWCRPCVQQRVYNPAGGNPVKYIGVRHQC